MGHFRNNTIRGVLIGDGPEWERENERHEIRGEIESNGTANGLVECMPCQDGEDESSSDDTDWGSDVPIVGPEAFDTSERGLGFATPSESRDRIDEFYADAPLRGPTRYGHDANVHGERGRGPGQSFNVMAPN